VIVAEYYKHEIAKWNVATDDLTLEQEAAYHRVVSTIRLYERPLKHNLRVLSGLWRCNERKAKRILEELIEVGKLTIEGGLIVDEKAVHDASILRQSRVDKQLAGREGGIESGKSRRKALENNKTGEAPASTREEKAREEKSINGGGDSASAPKRMTPRERILEAIGVDPVSGLTGRGGAQLGKQVDMIDAGKWVFDLGLSWDEIITEIRDVMSRKHDGPPSSFKFFDAPMRRLAAAKAAPPLTPSDSAQHENAGAPSASFDPLQFLRDRRAVQNNEAAE
jgi:hypothetical protein